MVGKRKAKASKSTKSETAIKRPSQKTLLAHFPKKNDNNEDEGHTIHGGEDGPSGFNGADALIDNNMPSTSDIASSPPVDIIASDPILPSYVDGSLHDPIIIGSSSPIKSQAATLQNGNDRDSCKTPELPSHVIDLTTPRAYCSPLRPCLPSQSDNFLASPQKQAFPIFAKTAQQRALSVTRSTDANFIPITPFDSSGTPWPSDDMQHIRGLQSEYRAATQHAIPLRKRVKSNDLNETTTTPTLPVKQNCSLDEIPEEHVRDHPVIAHVLSLDLDVSSQTTSRLWTDKWRPIKADHVLGNEENALYLREWMRALELTHAAPPDPSAENAIKRLKNKRRRGGLYSGDTKRATVIRSVSSKQGRKKRRIDNDDEDSDDPYTSAGGQSGYERFFSWLDRESPEPLPGPTLPPPTAFSILSNTIILSGPTGCGKTASVYACAEELGYEVFEVYPGIGRRNGANLESLVGEVGKNHLIVKAPTESSDENAFTTLMNGKKKDLDSEPLKTPEVRQSLILLEEVDILYKDDSNFWPSVINLIRECRRPVICTCNDLSLVPVNDLPVQTILAYSPCPIPSAVSYLQVVCKAEQVPATREELEDIYQLGGTSDIRRSLLALQTGLPRPVSTPRSSRAPMGWTTDHTHLMEVLSFADGYLPQSNCVIIEDTVMGTEDNEVGHTIIQNSQTVDDDRDVMAICLLAPRETSKAMLSSRELGYTVIAHPLIAKLLPFPVVPDVFNLDYLPHIRQMVTLEDKEEERRVEEARNGGFGRRMTKNSLSAVYIRNIPLTVKAREELHRSLYDGEEL